MEPAHGSKGWKTRRAPDIVFSEAVQKGLGDLQVGEEVLMLTWLDHSDWRASSCAPTPSVATRARSAATSSAGAAVRSRSTCQRMAGSPMGK